MSDDKTRRSIDNINHMLTRTDLITLRSMPAIGTKTGLDITQDSQCTRARHPLRVPVNSTNSTTSAKTQKRQLQRILHGIGIAEPA